MSMEPFRLHFVGVGPQRTGTTWLEELLRRHRSVCLPDGIKETMYFDLYYDHGRGWYLDHFAHRKGGQRCGEICPTYFDVAAAAERIHALTPDCRILVSLRDPVDRALSLYRHHLAKGRVNGSFDEAVRQVPQIVDAGRYSVHIPRWVQRFGRDRVAFVWVEDMERTPQAVFGDVCRFLELPELPMPTIGHRKINVGKATRAPGLARGVTALQYWLRERHLYRLARGRLARRIKRLLFTDDPGRLLGLTAGDRQRMQELFEPDIRFLEELLGRDLSAWRRAGQGRRTSTRSSER
jgi:hypothetical protein